MSERDKDDKKKGTPSEEDKINSPWGGDRGGRSGGGTPDYEKNQSSPISNEEFDNSRTSW